MAKRGVKLKVAAPEPLDSFSPPYIVWTECCLCQKNGGVTVCPAKNPNKALRNKGYETLALSLERIKNFDFKLPSGFKIEDLQEEGKNLVETFVSKSALWHKACALKYTKETNLQTLLDSLKTVPSVPSTSDEPAMPRTTRSVSDSINLKDNICFLCHGPPGWNRPLRQCETHEVSGNVQKCAKALGDTKLEALLITYGDLVAQEAKYHTRCLVNLYNKARTAKVSEKGEQDTAMCESLAFADLVLYMQGKLQVLQGKCCFRMGILRKMYMARKAQLLGVGEESLVPEQTLRLRLKILANFPDLRDELNGNEYILRLRNSNMLYNIATEDQDEDAIAVNRFVRSVRASLASTPFVFDGYLDGKNQEMSIPPALLGLVNMILYGSAVGTERRATNAALTVCNTIIFNFHRTVPKGEIVRHSKQHEPHFPIYMGLSSYGQGRNKSQITEMHHMGISISHNRVMEITSQLCRLVVKRAHDEGVVCPSLLKLNLFTVAALDNIDVKPSSTTSQGEFHGTGISIFQLPRKEDVVEKRMFQSNFADVAASGVRSVPELPESYVVVPDHFLADKQPPFPGCTPGAAEQMIAHDRIGAVWCKEDSWLKHIYESLSVEENCELPNLSWAAFHASKQERGTLGEPAISALLPLFPEKSSSVAMVRHGMDIVRSTTHHLNKDQVPVMCVDQPLFAIMKTVQWTWPDKYGEDKFVALFGHFHVELCFLKVIGQFMDGSGWVGIVGNSGVTTFGSAEAILKVTHVTKSRAAHQVTAAVLYALLQDAYHKDCSDDEMSFAEWMKRCAASSPTFLYWLTTLNLEILLLCFVRAIRTGDFKLLKWCLKMMMPWFFLLNHPNYARWLSVHLFDLENLESTAPEIYRQFIQGNFVVRKSRRVFSALAVDQAHEQHNADVKGSGGAVGLTQDAASLRRWTLGGPEVARLLSEFRSDDLGDESDDHHEQSPSFQRTFFDKCAALKDSFLQCENPFMIRGEHLIILDTGESAIDKSVQWLKGAEDLGKKMYKDFVDERLCRKIKSLFAPIPKSMIKIFDVQKSKRNVAADTVKVLKADVQLFSRLFIVGNARDLDMNLFFSHENQVCPPSLSAGGKMRSGVKCHLVDILEKCAPNTITPSGINAVIFDGAGLVHNVKPSPSQKTFEGYCQSQVKPHILKLARDVGASRVDVVWDLYLDTSIKGSTRDSRGKGVRCPQLPTKGSLPKDWADYLRNSENKQELFRFLAEALLAELAEIHIVSNVDERIKSSAPETGLDNAVCSTMEEADGRMILHARDVVLHGGTKVLIRSTDTDVVILAVSFFHELKRLGLKELWLLYGTGKHRRFIAVHRIASHLGEAKSVALRGFHAFSGCDSCSFFGSKGKKSCWAQWMQWKTEDVSEAFRSLSLPSVKHPGATSLESLEEFTVKLYGVKDSSSCKSVDEARKLLFATENRPLSLIPPTSAALKQHILRAAYQAGQVWGRSMGLDEVPSPEGWGWTKIGQEWCPVWTTLPEFWGACRVLDQCGCTTGCSTRRCVCRRNGLPCTLSCKKCQGETCENKRNLTTLTPEDPEEDVDDNLQTV